MVSLIGVPAGRLDQASPASTSTPMIAPLHVDAHLECVACRSIASQPAAEASRRGRVEVVIVPVGRGLRSEVGVALFVLDDGDVV